MDSPATQITPKTPSEKNNQQMAHATVVLAKAVLSGLNIREAMSVQTQLTQDPMLVKAREFYRKFIASFPHSPLPPQYPWLSRFLADFESKTEPQTWEWQVAWAKGIASSHEELRGVLGFEEAKVKQIGTTEVRKERDKGQVQKEAEVKAPLPRGRPRERGVHFETVGPGDQEEMGDQEKAGNTGRKLRSASMGPRVPVPDEGEDEVDEDESGPPNKKHRMANRETASKAQAAKPSSLRKRVQPGSGPKRGSVSLPPDGEDEPQAAARPAKAEKTSTARTRTRSRSPAPPAFLQSTSTPSFSSVETPFVQMFGSETFYKNLCFECAKAGAQICVALSSPPTGACSKCREGKKKCTHAEESDPPYSVRRTVTLVPVEYPDDHNIAQDILRKASLRAQGLVVAETPLSPSGPVSPLVAGSPSSSPLIDHAVLLRLEKIEQEMEAVKRTNVSQAEENVALQREVVALRRELMKLQTVAVTSTAKADKKAEEEMVAVRLAAIAATQGAVEAAASARSAHEASLEALRSLELIEPELCRMVKDCATYRDNMKTTTESGLALIEKLQDRMEKAEQVGEKMESAYTGLRQSLGSSAALMYERYLEVDEQMMDIVEKMREVRVAAEVQYYGNEQMLGRFGSELNEMDEQWRSVEKEWKDLKARTSVAPSYIDLSSRSTSPISPDSPKAEVSEQLRQLSQSSQTSTSSPIPPAIPSAFAASNDPHPMQEQVPSTVLESVGNVSANSAAPAPPATSATSVEGVMKASVGVPATDPISTSKPTPPTVNIIPATPLNSQEVEDGLESDSSLTPTSSASTSPVVKPIKLLKPPTTPMGGRRSPRLAKDTVE